MEKFLKSGKYSVTVPIYKPIYKGKSNTLDCRKHRGIRLLEREMKLFEKVLEQKLRKLIKVNDKQFEFCSGRSTIGAIFIMQKIQKKFSEKKKKLFHTFADLEKAFIKVME